MGVRGYNFEDEGFKGFKGFKVIIVIIDSIDSIVKIVIPAGCSAEDCRRPSQCL